MKESIPGESKKSGGSSIKETARGVYSYFKEHPLHFFGPIVLIVIGLALI